MPVFNDFTFSTKSIAWRHHGQKKSRIEKRRNSRERRNSVAKHSIVQTKCRKKAYEWKPNKFHRTQFTQCVVYSKRFTSYTHTKFVIVMSGDFNVFLWHHIWIDLRMLLTLATFRLFSWFARFTKTLMVQIRGIVFVSRRYFQPLPLTLPPPRSKYPSAVSVDHHRTRAHPFHSMVWM